MEFLIKTICKYKKCRWLQVHRVRVKGFLISLMGILNIFYTDTAKREGAFGNTRERECQGHIVLGLVGGNHNN